MKDALARARRPLGELRSFVDDHPDMKRPTYPVPHQDGVVGRAANFVIHVSELMDQRPASVPSASTTPRADAGSMALPVVQARRDHG